MKSKHKKPSKPPVINKAKLRSRNLVPLLDDFRLLSCIRSTDNAIVSNGDCSDSTEPQTRRVCNTQACPPKCTKKTLYKKLTETNKQLDMLLVIDDSGSMNDLSSKLAARLDGFVNNLKNSGIDWQMCVTTTSAQNYTTSAQNYSRGKGDNGRPIQWQGEKSGHHILRKDSGDLNQIFIDTIDYLYTPRYVGRIGGARIGGSPIEEGIRAMNLSIQKDNSYNCYRDKAALSVILISDEDESDYELLNTPQSFIQTVKNKFSPEKRLTVNSIVVTNKSCREKRNIAVGGLLGASIGHEYIKLSNLTGGSVQGICQKNYSIALNDIHNKINQSLSLSRLPLACEPKDKPTVRVNDGDYTHNVTVNGKQLFFNPAVQDPATIRGSYFCCEQ